MGRGKPGKYTERFLQAKFFDEYNGVYDLIVPNVVTWRNGIVDLLCIRKSGYTEDIEIKVTRADFRLDRKKHTKHIFLVTKNKNVANRFYYFAPQGIIPHEEVPEYAGLIELVGDSLVVVKRAPLLHKERVKHLIDYRRMARSLMYKTFNRRNKGMCNGKK